MEISNVSSSNGGILALKKNIQADQKAKAEADEAKIKEEETQAKNVQSLASIIQDSKLAMGTQFVTLTGRLNSSMSSKNYELLNADLLSMFNFVSQLTTNTSQEEIRKFTNNEDDDSDIKMEIMATQIADSAINAARASSEDEKKQLDKLKELRDATSDGIGEARSVSGDNFSGQIQNASDLALQMIDDEIERLGNSLVDVIA